MFDYKLKSAPRVLQRKMIAVVMMATLQTKWAKKSRVTGRQRSRKSYY